MARWLRARCASLVIFNFVALVESRVSCGGHYADSCSDCPQGNGRDWCNGHCGWVEDSQECVDQATVTQRNKEARQKRMPHGFPFPPDTRPSGCAKYETSSFVKDHTVSIIIPWLKEKWEHMEGTMKALLYFTPDELVEEFLFISDGNEYSYETELKALSSKVQVIALPEREGLIRAKMKGVEAAKAPILVFMEAHCIVNRDWLPPLLHRVQVGPRSLVMPLLDIIPQDDWLSYYHGAVGHWRYEWNFNLIHTNPAGIMAHNSPEPFSSPGTSGGILAMRKDWFQKLGLFDTGMHEWGGDHMELTMKVWRCGGRIEIMPCSRIGHLFRDPEHRPYDVKVNTVVHNYKRLAELWAMDHLDYFYKMKPEAVNMKLVGMEKVKDKYKELQTELGCKNLTWYLEHVDIEMNWEKDRICHPYADHKDPIRCKGKLVPGRWTVTETIPREEYLQRKKEADDKLAAEAKVASDGSHKEL